MKKYETPNLTLDRFDVEDVITASSAPKLDKYEPDDLVIDEIEIN